MIKCPSCTTENMPGSFFCVECGASFLPSRIRETTASLGTQTTSQPLAPSPAMPAAADPAPPALRVVVLNSGRKLGFTSAQPVVIGRQDSGRNFYPDLDLTTDGGLDAGVSRRHARILFQAAGCYLEDLDSSNGTFVNGIQLAPRSPTELHHSDEVRLGNILLRVELAG